MTIITFCTIILAAPAGVGGGGILVPMYLAIGHFSPHYGIPLSKATIFGGAVTNNYFNLREWPFCLRALYCLKKGMPRREILDSQPTNCPFGGSRCRRHLSDCLFGGDAVNQIL